MAERLPYQQFSSMAIVSLTLGISSGASLLISEFWVIAIPAIVCGVLAIRQTGQYQLRGRGIACCGVVLPIVYAAIWFGCERYTLSEFHSETLPGVVRVDFRRALTPQENESEQPKDGLAPFVGQRICLKGYSGPNGSSRLWGSFLLTADGTVKDGAVLVNLSSTMLYTIDALAVTGTLIELPVQSRPAPNVKYLLSDPEIRDSKCSLQLSGYRSPYSGC